MKKAENKQSAYECLQEDVRSLKSPLIEVWENKYADREYNVDLKTAEFTCVCPKTGLPDFAVINVSYAPDKVCLELKSFKMYLLFYRNVGIFHEHLANKILDDIVKAASPRWVTLEIIMNTRGGIGTTVKVEHKRPSKKQEQSNGKK